MSVLRLLDVVLRVGYVLQEGRREGRVRRGVLANYNYTNIDVQRYDR